MGILKTSILMAAMTAIFCGIGFAIGGESGMAIAFIVALGMNLFSYWNSDKIALRVYKAKPVGPGFHEELNSLVAPLAQNAKIPMPRVYVIESPQPNAFATGRNPENGAVAMTTGLMKMLNQKEIAGVIAHELAHIKNRDTLTMTVTATIAGAIGMLAQFALFFRGGNRQPNPIVMIATAILAPLAASIVQMAISRTREYEADRIGAEICRDPLSLASALAKIAQGAHVVDNQVAENNPATAHMFIINPLHKRKSDGLFTTHPHTANRIAALEAQAKQMNYTRPRKSRGPWG